MALIIRPYRYCYYLHSIKPVRCSLGNKIPIRALASGIYSQNDNVNRPSDLLTRSIRQYSTQKNRNDIKPSELDLPKPGLFQKFKQMYRDYWYVLVPVHIVTSAFWFGGFYYAVRSGVDVLTILEGLGVSEKLVAPLRDSSAGYVALTFALYKVATPLRYAVTIGGTTIAIKRLTAIGWIKPVPSRERIKEMFQEKRDNLQDRFNESKQHYQTQMKEKRSQMMDEMRRYKSEMRNLKNKVKKM